jgi:CPA2 family monovalent cation:H+ antiporter-2
VFVLTVAATALGLAYVSSFFGLSLALGALVAGIVASESELSHQILGTITPLRDIFAGIFFVSVGMLIDPAFVVTHLPLVVLIIAVIVLVKGAVMAGLIRGFHRPMQTALLTGVTLAHSGEFSFLLARLGVGLNVVSADHFSLMLAGTAGSMILAPSLLNGVAPTLRWYERRHPAMSVESQLASLDIHEGLRGHAVICGYGRVGQIIGVALSPSIRTSAGFAMHAHRARRCCSATPNSLPCSTTCACRKPAFWLWPCRTR